MAKLNALILLLSYQKNKLTLVGLFLVILSGCIQTAAEADLSSPENTVLSYCNKKDSLGIEKLFYPGDDLSENIKSGSIWSSCKIEEKVNTDKAGQTVPIGDTEIKIEAEDVEVVISAKMVDEKRGNPTTKFWFLLKKYKGEWKILSHSHIPDSNYPAYD